MISNKIISDQETTILSGINFNSVCRQSFLIYESSPKAELSIEGRSLGKNMLKALYLD